MTSNPKTVIACTDLFFITLHNKTIDSRLQEKKESFLDTCNLKAKPKFSQRLKTKIHRITLKCNS